MTLWLVTHGDFLSTFLKVLLKVDPALEHPSLYPDKRKEVSTTYDC